MIGVERVGGKHGFKVDLARSGYHILRELPHNFAQMLLHGTPEFSSADTLDGILVLNAILDLEPCFGTHMLNLKLSV